MSRKSLFHVEQNGSLHRHHYCDRVINQSLSEGTLRRMPLDTPDLLSIKAH